MVCISGLCILVRFLHELLLPWFAARNAIRRNDHKTLDWSWSYFLPLRQMHGRMNFGVKRRTGAL